MATAPVLDAAAPVIICNKQVVESQLTFGDVQNIYLGKKVFWQNGDKIIPVTIDDTKIHTDFLKEFVKKTPYAYLSYWNQRLFTGEGVPPIAFDHEKEIVHFVSVTPGAIGYVSAESEVGDTKVVKLIK